MCPASVDWHTDRIQHMLAVLIAFVCFYNAERILSIIAKFLVHLARKEEGRAEMGEERGRGRE